MGSSFNKLQRRAISGRVASERARSLTVPSSSLKMKRISCRPNDFVPVPWGEPFADERLVSGHAASWDEKLPKPGACALQDLDAEVCELAVGDAVCSQEDAQVVFRSWDHCSAHRLDSPQYHFVPRLTVRIEVPRECGLHWRRSGPYDSSSNQLNHACSFLDLLTPSRKLARARG